MEDYLTSTDDPLSLINQQIDPPFRNFFEKQLDVEMDPPIFTMRSVNNEKTEPEQARKQKQNKKILSLEP